MMSSFSYSQLLIENFEYTLGSLLTDNGWVALSGAGNVPLTVTSPGLTYPDYLGSGIGLATTITNGSGSREDCYKSFSSNKDTGSLYTSMMINVDTTDESLDTYFAAYLPSTSTSAYFGRLYVRQDGNGNLAFGISKTTAGSGGIFFGAYDYSMDVTYLLVLKYKFNTVSTTDDEVTLYVFSGAVPSTEPVTAYVGPITGTANDNSIGRVALIILFNYF